jgi:hypothetical protein
MILRTVGRRFANINLKMIDNRLFRSLSVLCLVLLLCSCVEEKSSLIISDGTVFEPKASFPKFSWDTTPMYYHFGDINRVLKPEEVENIAGKTDFIAIEKSHAYKMLGDAVLGAQHESEAFHAIKPEVKVLFYFNSFVAWPFTQFNKNLTPEGIAENPELKEFLVLDSITGKPIEKTNGDALSYYFNVLNPDFRQWWVESVTKGVEISGCDGAFIDRMNVNGLKGFPKGMASELGEAQGKMMEALKKNLGPDKILLGNNAADNEVVFPYCDAFMFEHYNDSVLSKENLLKEWGDMLRVAKAGKISIYRFGAKGKRMQEVGGKTISDGMLQRSKDQLEYYLACYLIGAQPYSYLQYNWGWNLPDGNLVDYPELRKPLGAPKAAYTRVNPEGWEFTREFEHASVWVDTEKKEAKITWR